MAAVAVTRSSVRNGCAGMASDGRRAKSRPWIGRGCQNSRPQRFFLRGGAESASARRSPRAHLLFARPRDRDCIADIFVGRLSLLFAFGASCTSRPLGKLYTVQAQPASTFHLVRSPVDVPPSSPQSSGGETTERDVNPRQARFPLAVCRCSLLCEWVPIPLGPRRALEIYQLPSRCYLSAHLAQHLPYGTQNGIAVKPTGAAPKQHGSAQPELFQASSLTWAAFDDDLINARPDELLLLLTEALRY
ncbi:hypothetical protein B0J12DRAFT_263746 [Macrophomina phaseolina]|uniref:Uncharacterized protein n=1 Tax=Macrophomina phaseolina TaxID=35725 RepID=A0ABQ8G1W5_9PEZI|nr:hypothetical protein B0J12DRAFT_263746 [Macrophomina phaseolina]